MESLRHQDIQISGHKITKQMIRETFALYSPEYEAFVIELPNKQFHGVLRRYPRLYLPAMRRKSDIAWEWVKYERCRIIRGLDIPPVDIVRANGMKNKETGEVTFKITRIDLTPRELYAVQYGDTFGIYAASAHAKGCAIRYAISRKGRSHSLVNEAFPTSYHVNTYSFFDNEDDYVLAKICSLVNISSAIMARSVAWWTLRRGRRVGG